MWQMWHRNIKVSKLGFAICTRKFSSSKSISPINSKDIALLKSDIKYPWKSVADPKGSGLAYWWNTETQETTALGAPRPEHWIEVNDPNSSSLTYWWNPETNQTTSLGEPCPNHQNHQNKFILTNLPPTTSFSNQVLRMVALGFSMSCAMILVRVIIGI